MDLDRAVVRVVVEGGEKVFSKLRKNGLREEILEGDGRKAFEYVIEHRDKFGEIPSMGVIAAKVAIDIDVDTSGMSGEFLVDELKKRSLFNALHRGLGSVMKCMESRDPDGALEKLRSIERSALGGGTSGVSESLLGSVDEVIEEYERAKSDSGVKTKWKSVDAMTGGFNKGDFGIIVSRSGIGKTWMMIHFLDGAHLAGEKVLFISPEMKKARIGMRFHSIRQKLAYNMVRTATLGTAKEASFFSFMRELADDDKIQIMGKELKVGIDSIESAIYELRPGLVLIDGMYMVDAPGESRQDRLAYCAEELKRMAVRYDVPIIGSSQFNRSVKGNSPGTVAAENIGITDVLQWTSDYIFGLYQTEDMRDVNELGVKPLKVRESELKRDIKLRWDFEKMEFDELDANSAWSPEGRPAWRGFTRDDETVIG